MWSPDHLAVWHLHQDPGGGGDGDIRDATGGGHDGTAVNMEQADRIRAQVGPGFSFNGIDEYLDFGSMDFGNTFTISMWVNFAGGSLNKTLMANTGGGGDQNGFRYYINSANTADRRLIFETGNGQPGSTNIAQTNTNAVPINAFTYLVVVVNRPAGTAFIYLDGARADIDMTIRNDFLTSSDFEIGRMENNVLFYGGALDEIQIASTLRPAEWIRTAFNNQSQPDNFHALGPEESRP